MILASIAFVVMVLGGRRRAFNAAQRRWLRYLAAPRGPFHGLTGSVFEWMPLAVLFSFLGLVGHDIRPFIVGFAICALTPFFLASAFSCYAGRRLEIGFSPRFALIAPLPTADVPLSAFSTLAAPTAFGATVFGVIFNWVRRAAFRANTSCLHVLLQLLEVRTQVVLGGAHG
jgi:hypothetical protein